MAARCWSSLPEGLINCVADCLLATNDLDAYSDLRAVCQHWRRSVADPRLNQHDDRRFLPTRWIMLDDDYCQLSRNDDGARLFVNTATGRFVYNKRLQRLDDDDHIRLVTSTTDGLLILAAANATTAAATPTRVVNPFTGTSIQFSAPIPTEPVLTADVVIGPSGSPTIVLASLASSTAHCAEPQSESFSVEYHAKYPANRLPLIAASKRTIILRDKQEPEEPADHSNNNIFNHQLLSREGCRLYAVVAGGEDLLAVLKWSRGMDVFRTDAAGNVIGQRVKSIGNQALFLGVRCVAVDADRFPTVEANCAYFQLVHSPRGCPDIKISDIYKFQIEVEGEEQEPEFVSETMDYVNWGWGDYCGAPVTLIQLLINYTMDIPGHPWRSDNLTVFDFPRYLDKVKRSYDY